MFITEDQEDAIRTSLEDYAASLQGMDRRGLLNARYEAPAEIDGLNYNNPEIRAAVDFWQQQMDEWVSRYGSIEGYNEFRSYASIHQYNAASAFAGRNQGLRDRFGYAGGGALYSNTPEQVANGYTG